jgi:hypothetical protein
MDQRKRGCSQKRPARINQKRSLRPVLFLLFFPGAKKIWVMRSDGDVILKVFLVLFTGDARFSFSLLTLTGASAGVPSHPRLSSCGGSTCNASGIRAAAAWTRSETRGGGVRAQGLTRRRRCRGSYVQCRANHASCLPSPYCSCE